MSIDALRSKAQGLTGIAKKVFDAVPLATEWTTGQILSELHRVTGTRNDHRIVLGCLSTLVEQGLAREPTPGVFTRVALKKQPNGDDSRSQQRFDGPVLASTTRMLPVVVPHCVEAPSHLERIAVLAAEVRSLGALANDLAKRIEDIGLELETEMATTRKDSVKYRQLQELLKD